MLAAMPRYPRVPAWMVVVLVSREILVTGLRAVAASRGRIIGAEDLGKYKMALQSIALQACSSTTLTSTWISSLPACSCSGWRPC